MSRVSIGDAQVRNEIVTAIGTDVTSAIVAAFGAANVADPAAITVTSGGVTPTFTLNNPNVTPDGLITIANGTTPTVAELQIWCIELNAQVVKARADLTEIRTQFIALLDSLQASGMLS